MYNLFVAQTADGNSAPFATTAPMTTTVATIAAWGNFGAPGSLAVKMSPDNGTTWIDFPTPITFLPTEPSRCISRKACAFAQSFSDQSPHRSTARSTAPNNGLDLLGMADAHNRDLDHGD